MVESLRQVGVADTQIQVVSVRAEVKSGLLTKSSSATYELKIQCTELEQLPGMLGAEPVDVGVQLQHAKRVSCTVRLSYAIA